MKAKALKEYVNSMSDEDEVVFRVDIPVQDTFDFDLDTFQYVPSQQKWIVHLDNVQIYQIISDWYYGDEGL